MSTIAEALRELIAARDEFSLGEWRRRQAKIWGYARAALAAQPARAAPLPFAVFDEFGVPADDRVQDHFAMAAAAPAAPHAMNAEIECDCLSAWNTGPYGAAKEDTVHPMYLAAFKLGYRACEKNGAAPAAPDPADWPFPPPVWAPEVDHLRWALREIHRIAGRER